MRSLLDPAPPPHQQSAFQIRLSQALAISPWAALGLVIVSMVLQGGMVWGLYNRFHNILMGQFGFDSPGATLLSGLLVLVSFEVVPCILWFAIVQRRYYRAMSFSVAGVLLYSLFQFTAGQSVCFDRLTGNPLKYFAYTPAGRVFSSEPGVDPKYGIAFQPYTKEQALQDGPNACNASPSPSTPSSTGLGNQSDTLACGHALPRKVYQVWRTLNDENGFLGCPTGHTKSLIGESHKSWHESWHYQDFSGGTVGEPGAIYWFTRTDEHRPPYVEIVRGCIFKEYVVRGRETSWLGVPVSPEFLIKEGRRQNFKGGYIIWDHVTGKCRVYQEPREGLPNVEVPGNAEWFGAGVHIMRGDHILFSAGGSIKWAALPISSGFIGPAGTSYTPQTLSNSDGFLLQTAPCASLIGKIGDQVFPIGQNAEVTASEEGELLLAANDRRGQFSNNLGEFHVMVDLAHQR